MSLILIANYVSFLRSVWYSIDQTCTSFAPTGSNIRKKVQTRSLRALAGPYWELTEPVTTPKGSEGTWLLPWYASAVSAQGIAKWLMVFKNSSFRYLNILACHLFVVDPWTSYLNSLDSFFSSAEEGFLWGLIKTLHVKGWHKVPITQEVSLEMKACEQPVGFV